MSEEKQKATIKNWREVQWAKTCIIGEVYNHPKFKAGDPIRTSPVVRWIDENTVETMNTIYTLENPAP